MPRTTVCTAVALTLAALACGCSTFHEDWDALGDLARSSVSPDHGLMGRWVGRWESEVNGHSGELRCIVSPDPDDAARIVTRYRATWAGVLSFEYSVAMAVEYTGALARFNGEEDLGWLAGGVYTYDGTATPQAFRARYTSGEDQGIFEMGRPEAAAGLLADGDAAPVPASARTDDVSVRRFGAAPW